MLKKMSDMYTRNYSNNIYTSYNAGTLIPNGNGGPPSPMLTQFDPNIQTKQVLHNGEQNLEKNIVSHNPYPEALNGQRPMTIVAPTYDQHIIKPPKANVTHGRIHDTEFIFSEDRNYTIYPDPSNYVIKLKDNYKNVTSVTLFNACIPNTSYLIDERNNLIYFRESLSEKLIAEIPYGDYSSIQDLTDEIAKEMTNVSKKNNILNNNSTYTVDFDTKTNKLSISSDLKGGDHLFSLEFYGGSEKHDGRTRAIYPFRSIGRIIGFPRKNFIYASGKAHITEGSNIINGNSKSNFIKDFNSGEKFYIEECDQIFTIHSIISDTEMKVTENANCDASCVCLAKSKHYAPNKYDLSSDSFVILDILELENVRSNSKHIDRAFAAIPMIFPHNTKNFVVSPSGGVPPYTKYFNPPLARLDRLTIQFKDKEGNIINFNGIENFLEFRIHTLNASGKYDPGVV